jgi:hypothetical protein
MIFNHQTTIGAMVALLPASTKSASAAGVAADGSNRCRSFFSRRGFLFSNSRLHR